MRKPAPNLPTAFEKEHALSRRGFLWRSGALAAAIGVGFKRFAQAAENPIQGFENSQEDINASKGWKPISDRKIRVGLVGYGVCKFSAAFGFQSHPNVEVVAVSDLIPERCAELAKVTRCKKTYPSLEELVNDKTIEDVMISTDAPSHHRHCIDVLNHGKHVAVNVPASFGSIKDAEQLFEVVKKSGLKY